MTDAELIQAAAEKVMGMEEQEFPHIPINASEYRANREVDALWTTKGWWNPLTSEADCWRLVDKLVGNGFGVQVEYCIFAKQWEVAFEDDGDSSACENNLDRRRAIVLAALKACGVEV